MKLLLDTHLLLWSAEESDLLSVRARELIVDPANDLFFSVASIWETAVKHARGRPDFINPPKPLRTGLLDHGYKELLIRSDHVIAAGALPPIHRDPFDRLLLGQALVEDLTLITADTTIARYKGAIQLV